MANEPTRVQVAAVVAFYMISALIMVFVNKAVLNGSPDLPFVFLSAQIVIAVILLHISNFIFPTHISLPTVDLESSKKLLPLVATGIIGLALNTLCLARVETSVFIIARGLALPFTITLQSLATRTVPKPTVILASTIVSCGFFLGVARTSVNKSSISILAMTYGVLSSFFLALHAVLVKPAAAHVNGSVVALTYYSNLLSIGFLLPFIVLTGELSALTAERDWAAFAFGSLVTGFFGFLLGIAGLLSIKVTSPVTHMFSSAARSVLQTMLGAYVFSEVITAVRGGSIALITIGAAWYTWIMSQPKPEQTKPTKVVDEEIAMLSDSSEDVEMEIKKLEQR